MGNTPLMRQRINGRELRVIQVTAPSSAYEEPVELPQWFVESRRLLDAATQHEVVNATASVRQASPVAPDGPDTYVVALDGPMPLPAEMSHRLIDGWHLWVGIAEAALIVLDDSDDRLLRMFLDGRSPMEAVAPASATLGVSEVDALRRIARLADRLANAGLLRGVTGRVIESEAQPERYMRIHLTQRCNLSCVHCYADSSPFARTDDSISLERWYGLVDDFADGGGVQVLLTGGEALVHPHCVPIMAHAKARKLRVVLFTNGILVPRHLDAIRDHVDEVQVSIDGPTPQSNDLIRGAGSFRDATRAVELLLEHTTAHVRVNTVVMAENFDDIKANYLAFAERWKGRVEFRMGYGLTTHGRGEDVGAQLGIRDVKPVVDRLMDAVQGAPMDRLTSLKPRCGYAEQVVVAQDGKVHPCHLLDGALAHIDELPYHELVDRLRQTAEQYDVNHTLGCSSCDIRNLCGGSCRVHNGKSTGNRRITDCSNDDKLNRLRSLTELFAPA